MVCVHLFRQYSHLLPESEGAYSACLVFQKLLKNKFHVSLSLSIPAFPGFCHWVRAGRVQAMPDWPTPDNHKQLHCTLNFANFYRCFISDYSRVGSLPDSAHLHQAEEAFVHLKKNFSSVLVTPEWEPPCHRDHLLTLATVSYWPSSSPSRNRDIGWRELHILSSCGLNIRISPMCVLSSGWTPARLADCLWFISVWSLCLSNLLLYFFGGQKLKKKVRSHAKFFFIYKSQICLRGLYNLSRL